MANSRNTQETPSKEAAVKFSSGELIAYSSILITLGASVYTFFSAIPEVRKLHDDNIRIETNLNNSAKYLEQMSQSLKEMDDKLDKTIIELKVLSVKSNQTAT